MYNRPNYGNSYMDANNRLGYSSVSKVYGGGGYSNKSIFIMLLKIMEILMNKILERLNLCFKIKEKNSNKPNKNMNMIWIMRER
jgi:hypothetical protein